MEFIGTGIALILTLMVFSYIFGDNFLFKLASHIFVGVSIGYAIIVVGHQLVAIVQQDWQTVLPALILCVLLIFKMLPIQNHLSNLLGNITLAFVLGVGAALSIGGVLFGTLIPQLTATMSLSFNPAHYEEGVTLHLLSNFLILLGTVSTLFYFTFVIRPTMPLSSLRNGLVRFFAAVGRMMIIITLAILFANAVTARVSILISRLQFLTGFLR